MEPRPTSEFTWAEQEVIEPVIVRGAVRLATNVVEPTAELKSTGWLARMPVFRDVINWWTREAGRWIRNHDGRTSSVGTVLIRTSTNTVADLSLEFGGVWANRGTDTLAGITVNVYERIS